MPDFAIEGGLTLALTRALAVAGVLAAFGTAMFAAWVAPRALARADAAVASAIRRHLMRLTMIELAIAIVALPLWGATQTANMAGAHDPAAMLAALPTVLADTIFGHLIMVQEALLLAAAAMPGRTRPIGVAILLAVACALQAGHGHAWAMTEAPSLLLLAAIIHLLAAGAWLGGLPALLTVTALSPAKLAANAARWFSPLGKFCVGSIVVSAAWQFWVMIGGLPGLVGTAYGWIAGVKMLLFGALFALAVLNRYWLAPALMQQDPVGSRRHLLISLAIQTGFGLLTVAAAGVLSSLPPAMHVQPVWPFPLRPSLDTVVEDPDFAREAAGAALALAGAVLAAIAAVMLRRRLRLRLWPILAGAAAVAWFATPHLGLLLVEANPTSFYQSPTGFTVAGIARGAALYPANCAACHGAGGAGDGPAAAGLPVPPADLTAPHLWGHSDGELFWWLTHGIATPEGSVAMPGFATTLSEDDRWDLIDFIRGRNAGLVAHRTGAWQLSLHAPDFQANCPDGRVLSLGDLRGRFVRLVFGAVPPTTDPPDVITISVRAPSTLVCTVQDANVPLAYAIIAGTGPAALAGSQMLIDGDGWLRAMQPSGASGWDHTETLRAVIREFQAHPLAADSGMSHGRMQM